jgi:hypothetical protein
MLAHLYVMLSLARMCTTKNAMCDDEQWTPTNGALQMYGKMPGGMHVYLYWVL